MNHASHGEPAIENPYKKHEKALKRIVRLMEKEGVNVTLVHAYWFAKAMERDAEEMRESLRSPDDGTPEEIAAHDVWAEYDSQLDASLDEARDHVHAEYEEIGTAMCAIYGAPTRGRRNRS